MGMIAKRCAGPAGKAWLAQEWKVYAAGCTDPQDADDDHTRPETTNEMLWLPDTFDDECTEVPASSRARYAKVTRTFSHDAHGTRLRLRIQVASTSLATSREAREPPPESGSDNEN